MDGSYTVHGTTVHAENAGVSVRVWRQHPLRNYFRCLIGA